MLTLFKLGMTTVFMLIGSGGNGYFPQDEFVDPGARDEDGTGKGIQSSGQAEEHAESWLYLFIPEIGTYTLREVLEEGTAGSEAFELFGEPIESYEPILLMTSHPTANNNGIVVLMIEEYCLGDFNDDGVVNVGDLSLFINALSTGDPAADLTGNGIIDIFDQIFFLQLVSMGCITV